MRRPAKPVHRKQAAPIRFPAGVLLCMVRSRFTRSRMRTQIKDRIVIALLILLFLGVMGGSAYFIIRTMMHWNAKGLG